LFGFLEGRFTEINPLRNGAQTVMLAAAVAFALARLIG
jgi:hypothetical protein